MTDREPTGSVGEEALKLLVALQDWVQDSSAGSDKTTPSAASVFGIINEHLATDGRDCRYCPICRAVSLIREASPEVRNHLTTAATSLLQAAASWTAPDSAGRSSRGFAASPVERIDLDDEGWTTE